MHPENKDDSKIEIAETMGEMADREYRHLRTAEKLGERIEAVERSSRVEFAFLATTHDFLRMKFPWYYRWHATRAAEVIHYLILLFVMGALIFIILER